MKNLKIIIKIYVKNVKLLRLELKNHEVLLNNEIYKK